jgi:alkyldihydroxyacetonephosphate synthase
VGEYHHIETAARKEVLEAGGSISHHHGVGKLRLPFLPDIMSPAMQQWRDQMKSALDPHNVFAAQLPLDTTEPAEALT